MLFLKILFACKLYIHGFFVAFSSSLNSGMENDIM